MHPDFNLSKLLGEARPESSLTSAAATNPIWLVSTGGWPGPCRGRAPRSRPGNVFLHCPAITCRTSMPCALQAPEILEGGRATAATDVYSFGMASHSAGVEGAGKHS